MEDRLQAVVDEFSRNKAQHEHAETASDQEEEENKQSRSIRLRVKAHHLFDSNGDEDTSSSDDEASET